MTHSEILEWLREENPACIKALYARADAVRLDHVGDEVHLRGLVELSNHCRRSCGYCGLRAPHTRLRRYRLGRDQALACAREAVERGYGTVVLQAGEDPELSGPWVADLVRRIKGETGLAVTLSLGERTDAEYALWREAGADRYLIRFETSNEDLFRRIHPPHPRERRGRVAILRRLRELGYEIGSGSLVGLPGTSYADLARDVALYRELDLDMIGLGPFIPHGATPLGEVRPSRPGEEQAPNTEEMGYKMLALARLVCPDANIPSTTALAVLNEEKGYAAGLQRGANVVMPNLTPPDVRSLYEIYPAKAVVHGVGESVDALAQRIQAIGRCVGAGRGDSPRYRRANAAD
ncbi:MAG: [FeFe] hydrogenase H-cluster radical SAM maturase HydE [Planctomycetota bacterium]